MAAATKADSGGSANLADLPTADVTPTLLLLARMGTGEPESTPGWCFSSALSLDPADDPEEEELRLDHL